jgi:hypothetical protein
MSPSPKRKDKQLPKAWSKRLTALKEYWKNSSNKFKLPTLYADSLSGLNYKFYNQYVTNIATVKNPLKKIALLKAVKDAKSNRTSLVNRVQKQKKNHQCTYMRTQSISSRCKISIKKNNKSRLCQHHGKLTVADILDAGNYNLVSGRQRTYKSTCIYKTSTVPGAGHGVFATRHFYPGDLITIYSYSKIISSKEMPDLKGKLEYDYVLTCGDLSKCFVGLTVPELGKGLGSFINAPGSSREVNCKFKYDKTLNTPYIVATKHIWKGTELFMSYNKGRLAPKRYVLLSIISLFP